MSVVEIEFSKLKELCRQRRMTLTHNNELISLCDDNKFLECDEFNCPYVTRVEDEP